MMTNKINSGYPGAKNRMILCGEYKKSDNPMMKL